MADQLLSAIQSYRQKQKAVEDESLFNAIREYRMKGVEPAMREDLSRVEELKQVPRAINLGEGGLPIGEEPMVSGPDILAMEPGQTKTFTDGPEGKPVEVRRAEAIGLTGKVIPEPISPDGMDYEQRAELIKQKEGESNKTQVSGFTMEFGAGETPLMKEISNLRRTQLEHDGRYKNWLSQMIGGGEGVTPSGEKVQTQKRTRAAIKAVGDFRQQIDDIIVNDKFLEYASTKGLTTPGYWSKKLGRIGIGTDEYQSEIEQLQKNPQARKLAEEWAMTTPEFGETVGDIFGRAWDGYAGAIGSGTVGPIGLVLKEAGLENVGQGLVDAAEYADRMRTLGQDPRKVGELAQFGRDVFSGIGFTAAAIVTGAFGNAARASLGFNAPRTIDLFQKANTLTFSGLNSAWGGYNEARANGATDEQAKQAALFSALTQAPLELVSPLQKWVGRFDPAQQSRIYKGLSKAAQAVIEGTEEALFNEMPQQIAGNLVKKYVYEPNQDIFEGTAYAGGVGGAAGVMASIFTQMLGVNRTQQQSKTGNELGSEESDIDSEADKESQDLAPDPESALAAQMMEKSTEIDNLKEEIDNDEMGLQAFETGTPERQQADMALKAKKDNLAQLEGQFAKLSAAPAPATEAAPATKTQQEINDAIAVAEGVVQTWDRANRNRAVDAWFENGMANSEVNQAFVRAADSGGQQLATHGMGKVGTLTGGLRDLLGLLNKNIDPNRGGGRLYTAPMAVRKGKAGFAGGTASGTSYRDGPFILVQNQEASALGEGITNMDQVAAVLVNEANIDQIDAIRAAIQAIRPDIIVAPYSQADIVASQLTTKSTEAAPETKEQIITRIGELNKEFDALAEEDTAGQDRVNKAIFAEQNKLAEMTAIEQGVEPQATTPTREMGLPPSGRRSPFGTFYPDRPVLQAFVKATDKAIKGIRVAGKRAQKLKNAIRTNIARNAGFLAGINAEVISSEDYGKLTGGKQVAADSGTYRAAYFGGKKYLVLPDVNQLTATTIKGEQRAASRDAALDQEARAADKKLEEEMIHLSMYQALQDEYAALKKPKQTEQQYIVSRIGQIAQEVKRTNPNAVPGVSEAYLGQKGTLDDVGFSMEFMRMVIQRVRTGQITEDLNAIRTAEREAFSDADKGAIASLKNSILNALKFVRNSLARYLGKGTSTREVKRMEDSINNILDEYGIVKGEANYEFKDYSAAQPKGEVSLTITPTEEAAPVEQAAPAEGEIVAKAAPYVQDIEVFDRNGENKRERQIVVEANSPEEAAQLVRNTPEYQNLSQKSRAKKLKFFTVGQPRLKRGPGESGIVARAGVSPKAVSEQRRITNEMLGELNDMIATLQPKRSRAGKEYVSRTTKKGKTYPASLVSPYSRAANLYTSNTYEESTKALNKLFTKNPDADFFTVVTEVATQTDRYGLTESEKSAIIPLLYRLLPAYREQIMESKGAIKDRENIALKSLDLEDNLAKLIVDQQQASARTLNAAKVVRQIGGAGTAVAAYKSKVIDALADLYTIIRGDFTQVAEAVRGDRRKAVDNVFTLKEVLSRISELKKKAERNPQAAVDSIRKAIAGKKTRKAREIVLEFCASMFDTNGDKYANMMVDETAKAIMSIGADRKEFSSDNVYRYIYQAFAAVAKQTAKEQAAIGVEPKAKEPKKREGKFLAQVKTVIGNDKAYKEFINQLKAKIGENYQDQAQFESDYKELFSMLGDRQWSDSMRNQAIKDSADFLDYKFNDLITYIGENRYAAQAAVKTHIKAELANIGATDEQINKFIEDTQNYLDEETAKRVKKSLGFDISKETGRIIGGKIEREAMKKVATAEERFQLAKTLKGLTKLAATDQRAFLDKLNELIITELGFDEATSQELSKYIEQQMAKAIQAQKSENLQKAIERAQETLSNNKIKAKSNQRTIIQRLIEMANMGQLDEFSVYEAFRQTHDFGRGYIEWNPELANQLREWGDRISALPEGVTRAIEEQKLGRFMLENQVFTTKDYFSSYWYFALLSQAGTQVVNFLGSTFNLLGNIAVWSIYTKGKATGPMLRALYRATIAKEAPSRNAFGYVMQTGLNPSGIQDEKMMKYPKLNVFEGANPKNTPKWAYNLITFGDGKIENAPSWLNATLATVSPKGMLRVMRATDAFMREAAYEARAASMGAAPFQQNAYNQAKEQAIRELASSKSKGKEKQREIIIRANEIYAEQRLAEDERMKAEEDALETIYSQVPVGVIGYIASLGNKLLQVSPVTQLFIPFTNVVANVLNENLNYLFYVGAARLYGNVELGPLLRGKIVLTPEAAKSKFIKGREDKAAEIAIKSAIGMAGMIVPVIVSALTGGDEEDQKERPPVQFYATGPSDPEQSKIWKENGGTPYSIRVGDKYVSYLYTPLVIPLATGSMLAEYFEKLEKKQEKTPKDALELGVTMVVSPFAIGFVAALDQSFLTGVADLIELKEAKDIPAAAENIVSNIVSRLAVPGVLRDMQKMLTDEKLEGDVYMTNLLREMPGSSEFLDKKLGYFGEPARYNSIIQENGPSRRALSLIGRVVSSETPDPAFEIMYRNGLIPPKWQGSLQWSNEVRMTKAEQREFVSIAGPIMKEWIIENEDIINDLTTEEAQDYISNNFSQIRRAVKADLEFEKGIGLD